ncbi:MAG TPA: chorismate-binding protein [Frankiaceae bacterium]|nr:chorismate-binding protein [Frankiaceae bacterium]
MTDAPGPSPAPWARFDDLPHGTGLCFGPPRRVLVARTPDEVAPTLAALDAATRAGEWAFGYVRYEAAPGLDRALTTCAPSGAPLVWFGLGDPPLAVPAIAGTDEPCRYRAEDWRPGWTADGHRAAVEAVRRHIAAGDIFQCTLTARLRTDISGDLLAFYGDLAVNQHSRYAAYLDLGDHIVAGASPELFFSWSGDRLLTRPMKGTAPRGHTPEEDRAQVDALLRSPKERAENIIVVDLLRNDVSRIASVGSVSTPALCVPERYRTVWQLTSDVVGTVPASTPLVDVFRALFPSGSVTGAPKPRAMRIIRDLEHAPRGVYCGAVGWVAPPSAPVRATFSVAIRTAQIERRSGLAVYGTGGGITWSSDPDAELAEIVTKTRILPTRRGEPVGSVSAAPVDRCS